jgi:hypothetical protein
MRVFVYFNLHRKLWSVKALSGPMRGRVIAHRDTLALSDCTFKVSEAGRQRVLREQRKNVHAGVVGYLSDATPAPRVIPVTYNPYKSATFTCKNTGAAIHHAVSVSLVGRNVTATA